MSYLAQVPADLQKLFLPPPQTDPLGEIMPLGHHPLEQIGQQTRKGWARVLPADKSSAGGPVLVQAAWGAGRKKNSYFQAQFLRLNARHGAKKAAIAVAASILTTVYHMLRDGTCYQDLGPEHFTRRNPAKAAARLANRIRNLGYHVEIRAAA
jgi:hypothetical protein